jgi:hypothetical protein
VNRDGSRPTLRTAWCCAARPARHQANTRIAYGFQPVLKPSAFIIGKVSQQSIPMVVHTSGSARQRKNQARKGSAADHHPA